MRTALFASCFLAVALVADVALACSRLLGPGKATSDTPVMVASLDAVAPAAPAITNVRLRLAPRTAPAPTGPIAGCTPVDSLAFDLTGTDDVTTPENLRAQIFVAADEASLAQATVKRTWALNDTFGKPASFLLEALVDRAVTPQFCFSVRLVDEASNAGPRSPPVCLDSTLAPADDAPPVGCAAGPGAPLLLAVVMLLRRRR
jgi:hypothetical protein